MIKALCLFFATAVLIFSLYFASLLLMPLICVFEAPFDIIHGGESLDLHGSSVDSNPLATVFCQDYC